MARGRYPGSLGVWPAAAFYAAFVWFKNVFADPDLPRNIALAALFYSLATFYGMALFGRETWLRGGEAFSVFFELLGRFAPTETRAKEAPACRCMRTSRVNCDACFARAAPEGRELNLRPPAVGLDLPERTPPGGVAFAVLVLAGVTFDGLLETPLWSEVVRATPVTRTAGLPLIWALFLGVYLGFVQLGRVLGGEEREFRLVAAAYALVPIAVAYQVAHYLTFLLFQGQAMVSLVSDPFGRGWDVFGTASFLPRYGVVGAGFVWYAQVGLVVAGHVVAVWLAHRVSARFARDSGRALAG